MQFGRILILVLLGAAVLCPEKIAAQDARRGRRRGGLQRLDNQWAVPFNGGLLLLPEWLEAERDVADDAEKVRAVEDDPGWRASVSDAGFDQSVFGDLSNAAAARQNLDAHLREDLEDLNERYGLSAVQKQKLYLAGRVDLKRLFDRVEESRRELQSHVIRDVAEIRELQKEFSRESDFLRVKIKKWPFGKGSLLAKTLKSTLTIDQIVAHEKWKRDRPAVVTRSWDRRTR